VAILDADKQQLLSGFLEKLKGGAAARLAQAVEVDRLIGGTELPHAEILGALRPQLRKLKPSRRAETIERLFCRPFEDLLASRDRNAKRKGRIARASVEPVWNWLKNELMPARHRELEETLRRAITQGREDEIESTLGLLWKESSVALCAQLSGEAQKLAAGRKLGGIAVAEDANEIALLLGNAGVVRALQKRLPKPVRVLTEEHVGFVRDLFDSLTGTNGDFAPYIPLVVMGRLERPWEALRLAAAVSRKSDDIVIANTDMGIVGELLFDDLDTYAQRIKTIRPLDFDARLLLSDLAAFSELSGGIVKEIDIRRDGKWGHRLAKDRATVSNLIEGLLERAPREILAGLPAAKAGTFSKGAKPLDVGRAPEPDRVERAMRYAHVIAHSRPYSVAAAFRAKLDEVWDETANTLRSYNEDILRELRAAPEGTRKIVEQHFANALAICELILGEEEAEFLRRRSRVGSES